MPILSGSSGYNRDSVGGAGEEVQVCANIRRRRKVADTISEKVGQDPMGLGSGPGAILWDSSADISCMGGTSNDLLNHPPHTETTPMHQFLRSMLTEFSQWVKSLHNIRDQRPGVASVMAWNGYVVLGVSRPRKMPQGLKGTHDAHRQRLIHQYTGSSMTHPRFRLS